MTYILATGEQGSVHIEQVREYHTDAGFLRELLLCKLTIEAQTWVETCSLQRREIIGPLGTSPAQSYGLIDAASRRKSVDKMLQFLEALECEIDLVVRYKGA